jgi:N-acetylmuramoyl-L-alanine amidase
VIEAPSPNRGERRGGALPDLVVIHHTAMASAEAALARLCDPSAAVSCHYLVGADGRLWHLVPEAERAWHAGAGAWGAVGDVNSRSIGIELANPGPLAGYPPFGERQMAVLEALLFDVMARWCIAPERVIAHSDLAPGRKADPGPKFDWLRLARAGLSVWAEAGAGSADWSAFEAAAGRIGYRAPEAGGWEAVLEAFRLRFRPGVVGPLGPLDVGLAEAVAAAYPCASGFIDADAVTT